MLNEPRDFFRRGLSRQRVRSAQDQCSIRIFRLATYGSNRASSQ